ncbi:hypothetical protein E1B28_010774 [Marasmius oreades]|uniref:Uncharacterized protein n=1 Tax=Marasmius oreades TaxID=181124 RepID=A0A9P7RSQ3_9AGAR|nr:uncharacterized protein E1B28_010774 [Marasmius oreades]KAG7089064.1 hypothetical protein E1B28_010774 [Marasmius oreades]
MPSRTAGTTTQRHIATFILNIVNSPSLGSTAITSSLDTIYFPRLTSFTQPASLGANGSAALTTVARSIHPSIHLTASLQFWHICAKYLSINIEKAVRMSIWAWIHASVDDQVSQVLRRATLFRRKMEFGRFSGFCVGVRTSPRDKIGWSREIGRHGLL